LKETPTAIIFLDGVNTADIKRFQQLLESEQSAKSVKNLTFVLLGNTGLGDTLFNPEIIKNLLSTAIRRQQKLDTSNRKSRRKK